MHIEVTDRQSLLCPILTYTMYHVPFLLKIESPCDCGTVHMPIVDQSPACSESVGNYQYLLPILQIRWRCIVEWVPCTCPSTILAIQNR